MGQQQLLLLVIAVILVGVAIIAGFEAMEKKLQQSAVDDLVNRNLTIATEAVFWKTKSDPFNGGNARYTGLVDNGMKKLFLGEETLNGVFKITKATDTELVITAVSTSYPNIGVCTFVENYEIIRTDVSYSGEITLDGCETSSD